MDSPSARKKNLIIPQKGIFVSSSNTRELFRMQNKHDEKQFGFCWAADEHSPNQTFVRSLSRFIAIDPLAMPALVDDESNLISWLKRFRWKLIRISCKFSRFFLLLLGTPDWRSSAKKASKSVFDWYSNKMDVFEEAIPESMFLYQSKHMHGGECAIGVDWERAFVWWKAERGKAKILCDARWISEGMGSGVRWSRGICNLIFIHTIRLKNRKLRKVFIVIWQKKKIFYKTLSWWIEIFYLKSEINYQSVL